MDELWTTLPNARRVLQHAQDARPAWLWSQDGQQLLWANDAAGLFLAKIKKHGLKRAEPAVPIKGQIARIIRLGSSGRTSLARIQFRAGEKPVSATCATTPLAWANDEVALLIVGVDAIDSDILSAYRAEQGPVDEPAAEGAAEPADATGMDALAAEMVAIEAEVTAAEVKAETQAEPEAEPEAEVVPEAEAAVEAEVEPAAEQFAEELDEAETPIGGDIAGDNAYVRELQNWQDADAETAYDAGSSVADVAETTAPEEGDDLPAVEPEAQTETGAAPEAIAPLEIVARTELAVSAENAEPDRRLFRSLSQLVDRLAADEQLYTPLTEADDEAPAPAVDVPSPEGLPEVAPSVLYKLVGRGFRPDVETTLPAADDVTPPAEAVALSAAPADPEIVERVSRYNFDELSRILNDRVGDRVGQGEVTPTPPAPPANLQPANGGALVSISGETLVLNRLPLGILVFRDQQILFANRAITEMMGYDSVESLRQAGLAAVFPGSGSDQEAGPINHIVQRDGTLVPVTARLQSMSWQGRPALMLSASSTEVRTGHEDAVRAFAQGLAELRDDGFFEASRSGMISNANGVATALLGQGKSILGQVLTNYISEDEALSLRSFLERPARFAETERPSLGLRSADGQSDIQIFTQGQAGIVSGYFGFVRPRTAMPRQLLTTQTDLDPALLARISRGVRRPLNTIIGFAELLRTESFDAERFDSYAQDIALAGHDIAALVTELDDYARLREGRYLPQRASLDLTELLESCVLRIRNQANGARVLLRNAISETLPRVTADRASLTQAVLNLLASAIDQSPTGGAVVISAQRLDDGGIAIHVRDSSNHALDMAERFVVFRDGQSVQGKSLSPVRSSVGLALTRSLLAVNAVSLSVDPAGRSGVLFSLKVPADLVDHDTDAP